MTIDNNIRKKYRYWEWRTIAVLFVGYALFYFVRKNLGMAIPAMEAELGISKTELGIFLTIHSIIYGLSRFVNGILVDRFSKKKIMSLGLLLTCVVNVMICFSPKLNGVLNLLDSEGKATLGLVYLIGTLWVFNGYFQGMGVPPCVSLMAHWIKPKELATKQSLWNVSHSIGAGIVVALCGYMLDTWGYSVWYLCFLVPALLALIGVPLLWFGLKDDPTDVGLPTLEQMEESDESKKDEKNPLENLSESQRRRILNRMVYANPYIWIIAISNFCIYVIRLTILDWGGSFLTEEKGMGIAQAGNMLATTEIIGGSLGMLLAGWLSDKLFKSKAHRTCFFCIVFATLSFLLFWLCNSQVLSFIFLVLSAFFIYGPQALYGVCASQQATKYAAGTGNGIIGIFGYASSLISGIVFGSMADSAGGWDKVFLVAVIFGAVGAIAIGLMWKAPADGYEKLNKEIKKMTSPELKERLSRIKHVALDMDGTIYLGNTLFPFTKDFLAKLSGEGIGYSFLTNNPSKSVADYLKKLEGLGIEADEENMYTTSLAAIDYIKAHHPQARRLFLLGTPSMVSQFEKAGFVSCEDSADDRPDVLVVAFDMTLEYSRLCRAAWWASQGVPYIATNPDRVCPTDQPVVLVDCGSICKCIEHATGRQPDITLGKPDPNMLKGILDRHGLKPEEIAMVGDRIYTDTAMAHNAGAFGVLVLSGETTLETAEKVAEDARNNPAPEFFPPDLIVRDIEELGELLLASRR